MFLHFTVARGEKSPAILVKSRAKVWRAVDEKAARFEARQAEIAAQLARCARGEWGPEHMAALDRMLGDDAQSLEVRRRFDCI